MSFTIKRNIPFSEYRSWDAVNASLLKKDTPEEMFKEMQGDRKELTTTQLQNFATGDAVHASILEPHMLESAIVVKTKTVATKEADEARAANPGKLVLTQEMVDTARWCRDSVMSQKYASWIVRGCEDREISLMANDPETGHPLKSRIDLRPIDGASFIADLKTVSTVDSDAFSRALFDFGYILQAALYLDLNNWCFEEDRSEFCFVVVQKTAPYHCRVFQPLSEHIEIGRQAYKKKLAMFLDCLRDNH